MSEQAQNAEVSGGDKGASGGDSGGDAAKSGAGNGAGALGAGDAGGAAAKGAAGDGEVTSILGAQPDAKADDKAKPEGDAKPYAPEVPKELEQFADKAMLEKFAAFANEKKLAPDVANALVKMDLERRATEVKTQDEAVAAANASWLAEVKADKELGGAKFNETIADVGRAFAAAGEAGKAAAAVLEKSGLTNNPDLVRFIKTLGEKLREDSGTIPGAGQGRARTSDWLEHGSA